MRKFLAPTILAVSLLIALAIWPSDSSFDPRSVQIAIPTAESTAEYLSPAVRRATFNAWFVKLKTAGEGEAVLTVRFGEDDWQSVSLEEIEERIFSGFVLTAPTQHYQFRIELAGKSDFEISNLEITTQDTRSENFAPAWPGWIPTAYAQLSDLSIITRAKWNADPVYLLQRETAVTGTQTGNAWAIRRQKCNDLQTAYPAEFQNDGRKIEVNENEKQLQWTRTYSKKIKKIIIHETASDNGKDINGDGDYTKDDAMATVRAIYYNHAMWRGWGDIGYHYIIDPFGNIYEGRSGGELVIGAHVYCANTGTIGISFIGHFEESPPTDPALSAAVKLLGELANLYDLDLTARSEWHGRLTYNLVGHRDYGASLDPPALLYDLLPELQTRAMSYARDSQLSTAEYDYRILTSDSPVYLQPLEHRILKIELKNIGQKAWQAGDRLTISRSERIENQDGIIIGNDDDLVAELPRQVSAGNSIMLEIPVSAKLKPGRYRFGVTPNFGSQLGRKFYIVANIGEPRLDYEFIDAKHPPYPFGQSSSAVAWVDLRNETDFTWYASGDNRAYLGTVQPENEGSPFAGGSPEIGRLDADTPAGEIGRFTMNLVAPEQPGRYYLRFAPAVYGLGYLPDYGMNFHITVREPRFSADVVRKSAGRDLRFGPGESRQLFVELKNTSQLIWDPAHFELFVLQNTGLTFDQESSVITANIPKEGHVSIPVRITAPVRAGKYRLTLRPRWSNGKTKSTAPIDFLIEVEHPQLTGELVERPAELILAAGEASTVSLGYQNTGNVTWHRDDIVLQRLPAEASLLASKEWISFLQPTRLREAEVRPGETGHFDFEVVGTGSSKVSEEFAPIVRGVGRVRGQAGEIIVRGEAKVIQRPQAMNTDLKTSKSAPETSGTSEANLSEAEKGPNVRIRLSFDSRRMEIGGGPLGLYNSANQKIFTGSFVHFEHSSLAEGQYYQVRPETGTILEVSNWAHHPAWTTEINDNRFRGVLEVRKYDGELVLINELPLEDYIRGIAEPLPSDPWEKAKLLAVLARSYALYYIDPAHRKFPSAPYDGSDNPAEFQRYLGYSYELRGQMPVAAEATTGLVATYNGGVVKTPYFTSSGGRTRTVVEARWAVADFPFVRSVSDPWSCGLNSNALGTQFSCSDEARGHGVGVSGKGAAGLALEGKTYEEIIDYFFEGIDVKKVY